jgi:sRNA-binding regulator protein Hfq
MSTRPTLPPTPMHRRPVFAHVAQGIRHSPPAAFPSQYNPGEELEENRSQRQAEMFYLQKQIQSQTPMVIVLEDGEHIEGTIEWYDRQSLKVRGRSRTLIYKTAIKYMYKVGDAGNSFS